MIEILAACHITQLATKTGDGRHPPMLPFPSEPTAPMYLVRLLLGYAALAVLIVALDWLGTIPCSTTDCIAEAHSLALQPASPH